MLREEFEEVMDFKRLNRELRLMGFIEGESLDLQWVNWAWGITVLATPKGACVLLTGDPASTPFTTSVEELMKAVREGLRKQGCGYKF